MNGLDAVLQELDAVIVKSTPARKSNMLRRFTDQLIGLQESIAEEQVVAFDRVIVSLARDVEREARRELAAHIAPMRKGPRLTLRDLAFDDDASVSTPVLRLSPCIDEDDLVEIAREKSQEHLLAIAHRRDLPVVVTDILVDRGDAPVQTTVTSNHTARFSDESLIKLAELAEANEALRLALRGRRDVPSVLMERMMAKVERMAVESIAASTVNATRAEIETAVSHTGRAMQDSGFSLWPSHAPPPPPVPRKPEFAEADVVKLFREQRLTEALLALAAMAHLPAPRVIRIFASGQTEPLLCVLKRAGFAWDSVASILKKRSGAVVIAGDMQTLAASYAELTREAADDLLAPGPASAPDLRRVS